MNTSLQTVIQRQSNETLKFAMNYNFKLSKLSVES
jgi:hypothetical protein